MAIRVASGSTADSTNTPACALAAGVWTEIRVADLPAFEVHIGCRSVLDVEYAYGVGDAGNQAQGIPISGSVSLRVPANGRLAVRSTAGGNIVVAAVP